MATVPVITDGDLSFPNGMDSFSEPYTLPTGKYTLGVNLLHSGGVAQTRPGFRTAFKLPSGKLQGLTAHTPSTGLPQLLATVDGQVYASDLPFHSYRTVAGATMSSTAKQVFTCQTIKSLERNPDKSLKFIRPRTLTIFQDGINPPAYYDGSKMHVSKGKLAIPQGTVMAFAGGRLWVARREKLFASDLADPLSFYEQTFNALGGLQYFILPGAITGLTRMPGQNIPMLLAFTDETTTSFRSDILDRSLWGQVEDFQRMVFHTTGCVSQRSIVSNNGLLWWYSLKGQTRIDIAQTTQISSRSRRTDREVIRSKNRLAQDLTSIASAHFADYLLTSVPHADNFNRHTWVLDDGSSDTLTEEQPLNWASVWTGVRPVEWATVKINGVARLFCASVDADGENRVYEAFIDERRDNGCDIPWAIETRAYAGQTIGNKELRFAEYRLSELAGQTNLRVSWAGASRGQWKVMATPTFMAREGSLDARDILEADSLIYALKKQTRTARTRDLREAEEDSLSSNGIEGPVKNLEPNKEAIDTAFQLRIEGSGQCGLRMVELFMDQVPTVDGGQPETIETDERFVRFDGAASDELSNLNEALPTFTAHALRSARYGDYVVSAEADVESRISQADADKRAGQLAQRRADYGLSLVVPPRTGGTLVE